MCCVEYPLFISYPIYARAERVPLHVQVYSLVLIFVFPLLFVTFPYLDMLSIHRCLQRSTRVFRLGDSSVTRYITSLSTSPSTTPVKPAVVQNVVMARHFAAQPTPKGGPAKPQGNAKPIDTNIPASDKEKTWPAGSGYSLSSYDKIRQATRVVPTPPPYTPPTESTSSSTSGGAGQQGRGEEQRNNSRSGSGYKPGRITMISNILITGFVGAILLSNAFGIRDNVEELLGFRIVPLAVLEHFPDSFQTKRTSRYTPEDYAAVEWARTKERLANVRKEADAVKANASAAAGAKREGEDAILTQADLDRVNQLIAEEKLSAEAEARLRGEIIDEEDGASAESVSGASDPLAKKHDPHPFGIYDVFKTLVTWTVIPIAPLRILTIIPLFVSCWFFSRLALLGLDTSKTNGYGMKTPHAAWRRALMRPVAWLARLALFVGGFHWISVKGKPASPLTTPIVVANHVSLIDPIVLFSHLNAPQFIAKAEVAEVPLIGAVLLGAGVVLLDRTSPTSRSDAQTEVNRRTAVNKQAAEAVAVANGGGNNSAGAGVPEHYQHLMIFPEGTTTTGDALIDFKLGAFRAGVPVQPVAIRYPHDFFNPTYAGLNKSGVRLMLRILSQWYNKVEVEYLEPHIPSANELADPLVYAANVRKDIAQALGVPLVSSHAY